LGESDKQAVAMGGRLTNFVYVEALQYLGRMSRLMIFSLLRPACGIRQAAG